MSHDATDWAIKQRGMKPAAKLVLWHLCFRYNPTNGCFPSQKTLADDCEMSERSIRDQLVVLEKLGLIRKQKRKLKGGTFTSDRYSLAFESDFERSNGKPAAKFANGKNAQSPAANLRRNQRQILPPNTVSEQVIEQVSTRERADVHFLENLKQEIPREDIDKYFDEFWNEIWPNHQRKAGMEDCRKLYFKAVMGKHPKAEQITPQELNNAARAYIGSVRDMEYLKAPFNWLNKTGWEPFVGVGFLDPEQQRYRDIIEANGGTVARKEAG